MPRTIREILPGRHDFSPLLSHLTRGAGQLRALRRMDARRRVRSMLQNGVIEARNAHGMLRFDFPRFPRQIPQQYLRAVCLTDTPPEELHTVIGDIEGRADRLDNYGLVFSKRFIMEAGGTPVIYLSTATGNVLADAVFGLVRRHLEGGRHLDEIAAVLPLIETVGPGYFNQDRLVDFHWEREWRVAGNLEFRRANVLLGLCDEDDIGAMEREFAPIRFVDPLRPATWAGKIQQARAIAWDQYLHPFP